ncbi:MAG: DNA adenine methylase [Alphaproteobacteria bacterium]|nr:DNA adenine methylase [Alphaproteobacteria bacterium]MCL2505225.1 DNA adenine methylase [Alphaproteobacteria bacterium]
MEFNTPYYTTHLITYIGNKRALLPFINTGIETVKKRLGKKKLAAMDGFAGSGVVSRLLKAHASELYSNDLEAYAYVVNKCFLSNKSLLDMEYIKETIDLLNSLEPLVEGFIYKNYAPKNDDDIKPGERVFYTSQNARVLDTIKKYIFSNINPENRHLFLAPLITEASIRTNTSGVFKGFHKKNGIGHFGGAGENALERIKKKIKLSVPIFSEEECEVFVSQSNINEFIKENKNIEYDLAYYDPPYNQHPYGSNYFMLNILAQEKETVEIQDGISGITKDWKRSAYNKRKPAIEAMDELIEKTPAKYILVSYNNEGIIPFDKFKTILEKYGKVSLLEQDYNTYRGSRNLNNRNIKVKELLWIVEKKA